MSRAGGRAVLGKRGLPAWTLCTEQDTAWQREEQGSGTRGQEPPLPPLTARGHVCTSSAGATAPRPQSKADALAQGRLMFL